MERGRGSVVSSLLLCHSVLGRDGEVRIVVYGSSRCEDGVTDLMPPGLAVHRSLKA